MSQGQGTDNLAITVDTGSKYNIVDQAEADPRGWKVEKITQWEKPSLRCADGRKMKISGKTSLWLRLAKEDNKRKVDLYVAPHLRSKLLIGLINLKRLRWVSPQWPLDIEKWQKLFNNAPAGEEDLVNNINEDNNVEEEVTMDKVTKEDNHEEEEEEDDDIEEQGGTLDITDFKDLKTYKDIPNFANFPTWLQNMIKEFKSVFTNQISEQSVMNVDAVKFSLHDNVEIPNNNLTAHLPPANLRESADRLLDKLERGGLIKKAPRVCRYKSKAFFKPKRNNEARLLIDYKASQVNSLIQRPTHPQFRVEQLVQQVKPGMNYFLSADLTGAYFCHPLQEGPNGGDLTYFLTHRGKYIFKVLPQGCAAVKIILGAHFRSCLTRRRSRTTTRRASSGS